jgi:sugar fermentation stimulation protein A
VVDLFFDKKLTKGLIMERPNRFVMKVRVNGDILQKAYCPSTGRIGDIVFNDVPCLLSENKGNNTLWTVQAIYVYDKWIGINQIAINEYIDFFLKQGELRGIVGDRFFRREKKIGNVRIDFASEDNFLLEIKMPLISLLNRHTDYSSFNSFGRFIKHFDTLKENSEKGNGSVVALCYMYDAAPFSPPPITDSTRVIHDAAARARDRGVETWQINLSIDDRKVSLLSYFRLHLEGRVGVDILV